MPFRNRSSSRRLGMPFSSPAKSNSPSRRATTSSLFAPDSRSYRELTNQYQGVYVRRGGVRLEEADVKAFLEEAGVQSVDSDLIFRFILTARRLRSGRRRAPNRGETNSTEKFSRETDASRVLSLVDNAIAEARPMKVAGVIVQLMEEALAAGGSFSDITCPAPGIKRKKSMVGNGSFSPDVAGKSTALPALLPPPSPTVVGQRRGSLSSTYRPPQGLPLIAKYLANEALRSTSLSSPPLPAAGATNAARVGQLSSSGSRQRAPSRGRRSLPPLRQLDSRAGIAAVEAASSLTALPSQEQLSADDAHDAVRLIHAIFSHLHKGHPSRTDPIPLGGQATSPVPLPILVELGILSHLRSLKRATRASQAEEAARVVWVSCGMSEDAFIGDGEKQRRTGSVISRGQSIASEESGDSSPTRNQSQFRLPLSVLRKYILDKFFPGLERPETFTRASTALNSPQSESLLLPTSQHPPSNQITPSNGGGTSTTTPSQVRTNASRPRVPSVMFDDSTSTAPPGVADGAYSSSTSPFPSPQNRNKLVTSTSPGAMTFTSEVVDEGSIMRRSSSFSLQAVRTRSHPDLNRAAALGETVSGGGATTVVFASDDDDGYHHSSSSQLPSKGSRPNLTISNMRRSVSLDRSHNTEPEPTLTFAELKSLLSEAADNEALLIDLVASEGPELGLNHQPVDDDVGPVGMDVTRSDLLFHKRQQLSRLLATQPTGTVDSGGSASSLGLLSLPAQALAHEISSDIRNDLLCEMDECQHNIALLLHGTLLTNGPRESGGRKTAEHGLPTFAPRSVQTSPSANKWSVLFALIGEHASPPTSGSSNSQNGKSSSSSQHDIEQIVESEMTHEDILERMLSEGPLSNPRRTRGVLRAMAAFGRALDRSRVLAQGGAHLPVVDVVRRGANGLGKNTLLGASSQGASTPVAGGGNIPSLPSPTKMHLRSVIQAALTSSSLAGGPNNHKQSFHGTTRDASSTADDERSSPSALGEVSRQFQTALESLITPYIHSTAEHREYGDRNGTNDNSLTTSPRQRRGSNEGSSASPTKENRQKTAVESPLKIRLARLKAQLEATREAKLALMQDLSRGGGGGLADTTLGTASYGGREIAFKRNTTRKKPFRRRLVDRAMQTDFDAVFESMVH